MRLRVYRKPENVGWLGWLEGEGDRCIGFVRLDGTIQFGW